MKGKTIMHKKKYSEMILWRGREKDQMLGDTHGSLQFFIELILNFLL